MFDRTLIPCITLLFMQTLALGQDQRRMEFTIEGAAKDTVFLANYYGNRLFYYDTAVADARGKAVFASKKGYKAGIYAVVVPGPKYFEVIVNEPEIIMHSHVRDLIGDLKVDRSEENARFIAYIRYLNMRKAEGDKIRSDMATADPIAKAALQQRLEELDKEVRAYQAQLVAEAPQTYAARIVRMGMAVERPEPRKPDGTLDSTAAYYQYRAHFWDHFDLTDERLVRTPVFQNKLDEYFGRIIPQVPDTLAKEIDAFVARLGDEEELFRFVVHHLTHKYETSDIMGMDGVFAHMALTYYCPLPGQASRATWMADDKLEKLCERARKLAPLTLGKKAPYLCLTDTTEEQWINFHNLPNDYVVIVFWDPHCGVCKKELPELHKAYKERLQDMGVEVFAVAKAVEEKTFKDWKKFIRENELDWVNVGLTPRVYNEAREDARKFIPRLTTLESLNYSETYDVFSTPKVFVVDKDRRFVAKQLNAEQIADLVTKLRERKGQ